MRSSAAAVAAGPPDEPVGGELHCVPSVPTGHADRVLDQATLTSAPKTNPILQHITCTRFISDRLYPPNIHEYINWSQRDSLHSDLTQPAVCLLGMLGNLAAIIVLLSPAMRTGVFHQSLTFLVLCDLLFLLATFSGKQ